MVVQQRPVPAHIPAHLVVEYDRFHAPQLRECPHRNAVALFETLPPIFYTPLNRGHWVVTRTADAVEMLRRFELFSSNPVYNDDMKRSPRTAPNQYDPPEQTQLRDMVNASFTATAVDRMEPQIRAFARTLIADVLPRGRCEFLSEIGQRFPVDIFLAMAGAPLSHRVPLLAIVERFTKEPALEDRLAALRDLADYLADMLHAREVAPQDDLLSRVAQGTMNGRPLDDEEKRGFAALLFLGGLDTVAAMLSFIMAFLARNPEHYRRLVDDPAVIPRAVEELMRVHGVAQMERAVAQDTDFRGVQFKQGDRLVFLPQIYGLADAKTQDPFRVDFDRKMVPHYIFGAGPHRCIGSNLARTEIRVFLEEWTKSVPSFAPVGGDDLPVVTGIVWSPVAVDLRWPA